MKLYYTPGACSMAAHMVLREIGKPFELEKVDLKNKVTETGADFRAINPKGAVPALALKEGDVLTEAAAIVQFIADSNGATTLSPAAGTIERARVQEVLNYVSSELHGAFGPLFTPGTSEEVRNAQVAKISAKFNWLESRLADGRPYLTGESFTVADAYAFVIANWANVMQIPLDSWPKLAAFIGRVAQRPTAQATMQAEGLLAA